MTALRRMAFAAAAALIISTAAAAHADQIYSVTVNTAALASGAASENGPFSLAFELLDGSATADSNNTAMVSNFDFGGASNAGFPGAVTLTDNDFLSTVVQGFNAAQALSFTLDLSGNADADAPDVFGFTLLDGSGLGIPTTDLDSGLLFYVELGPSPVLHLFTGDPSSEYADVSVDVEPQLPSTVPEPSSVFLLATGALAFAARRKGWR